MRKRLQKLKALRAEVIDLERKIKENRFKPTEIVADTAKDYRTGQGRTIVIRGYGDASWSRLREKYLTRYAELNREVSILEDFLASVDDADMRMILRLRYEDGCTYRDIGERLGYSWQAIQKKEKTFWEGEK